MVCRCHLVTLAMLSGFDCVKNKMRIRARTPVLPNLTRNGPPFLVKHARSVFRCQRFEHLVFALRKARGHSMEEPPA
jgi:hypothetical protein